MPWQERYSSIVWVKCVTGASKISAIGQWSDSGGSCDHPLEHGLLSIDEFCKSSRVGLIADVPCLQPGEPRVCGSRTCFCHFG
jgi:hypothetical protein